MPLIPEGIIDEIQTRTDIAELIGRYVPLKRSGRHFKGNCPFHKERTPSFMVNTDKQIFHCFGCGVGGNIFSFLMQHDRLTFPEAVRQLGDQTGVHVPDREPGSDSHARESLLALTEKICGYFERLLQEPVGGKTAREYLAKRGVSERTRQQFRIGLAPNGWDRLLTAAKGTGVSAERLEAAGLVIQGKSGHYDRFRQRLMFPITDVRGRVIGFGGRSLDGTEPKYLNGPETMLYTKGHHLFGLAQAKDAMVREKSVVVVEGYFDCVVLAEGGVTHVVSPLGTALTADQARVLKRYVERVVLAFDADAAGEQATLRGIDLLVEAGLQVQVAQLPSGVDPDECLRAYGRERFQHLLDHGLEIFDFLMQSALHRYPGTGMEEKTRVAQFMLPTIAKVPNAILRSEYVRQLADRLDVDEQAMAQELRKIQPRLASVSRTGQGGASPDQLMTARAQWMRRPIAQGPERLLTGLMLDDPDRWEAAQRHMTLDDVTDPVLRQVLAMVCELRSAGHAATPAHIVSRLQEAGQGPLVTELVELAQSVPSKDAVLHDCVRRIRTQARKRLLAQLREQIRAAQDAGHDAEVSRLLAEYQEQVSNAQGG